MNREFKVGTRVVLARPDKESIRDGFKAGAVGTIVEEEDGDGVPLVQLDNGSTDYFEESELDTVSDHTDENTKLKARVEVLENASRVFVRAYSTQQREKLDVAIVVAEKALAGKV